MIDDLNFFITSSDVKYSRVGRFFLNVFFFDIVSQNEYLMKGIELGKRLIEREEKENRNLEERMKEMKTNWEEAKTTWEVQKCEYKETIEALKLRLQLKEEELQQKIAKELELVKIIDTSVSLTQELSFIKEQWLNYQINQLCKDLRKAEWMMNLDELRHYKFKILEEWFNTHGSQLSEKEIQIVRERVEEVIEVIIKEVNEDRDYYENREEWYGDESDAP